MFSQVLSSPSVGGTIKLFFDNHKKMILIESLEMPVLLEEAFISFLNKYGTNCKVQKKLHVSWSV